MTESENQSRPDDPSQLRMSEEVPPPRRRRRWLRRIGIAVLGLMILLACAVILLPHALSTRWFRAWIESKGSDALHRPIHLDRVEWSWADGLHVKGVRVEDAPAFSDAPLLTVERVDLDLSFGDLMRRRMGFVLELEGLRARMIRDAQGKTNLDLLLAQLREGRGPGAETPPTDQRGLSLPVPLEVEGRIRLKEMSFLLEDRGQGKSLRLDNASLFMEIPPLSSGDPMTMELSAVPILDGSRLEPIHLKARAENLLGSADGLDMSSASVEVKGELPGCRVSLSGDMAKGGGSGRVDVDLPAIMEVVRPFLPPRHASTQIAGHMGLTMALSGDSGKAMSFDVTLEGEGLSLSGGPLGSKVAGPVHWRAVHQGVFQPDQNRLTVKKGEIHLMDKTRISWQAVLEHLNEQTKRVAFDMGPATVDLGELRGLAQAFLPDGVLLRFDGGEGSAAASVKLKALRFSGSVSPEKPSLQTGDKVQLTELTASLPGVHIKAGETTLSATALNVSLGSLESEVQEGFPPKIEARAGLDLGKLRVEGPQEATLEGLKVPSLDASVSLDGGLPRGASIKGALGLQRLEFKGEEEAAVRGLEVPSMEVLAQFVERLPSQANIRAALRLEKLRFKGEQEVEADRLEVPSLEVSSRLDGGFPTEAVVDTALRLAKATLGKGQQRATVEGLDIRSMAVSAHFAQRLPSEANVKTALHLDKLVFAGQERAWAEGLEVSSTDIAAHFDQGLPSQASVRTALRLGRLKLEGDQRVAVEKLEVPSMNVSARLEAGFPSEANIEVAVRLGQLRVEGAQGATAEGLEIPSLGVSAHLRDRFPSQADIRGTLKLGKLELKGERPLRLKGLDVAAFDAVARKMRRSKGALFGLVTEISLKESISIEAFHVPSLASISGLRHSLDAQCVLSPNAAGSVTVKSLSASIPSLRLEEPEGASLETSATVDASIGRIELSGLAPLRVEVRDVKSRLAVEDLLEAQLDVQGGGLASERIEGKAQVAFRPARLKNKGLLPEGLGDLDWGDGTIRVGCEVAGRLPKEDEIRRLSGGGLKASEMTDALGFLDRLELMVNLEGLGVGWPAEGQGSFKVDRMATAKPLRIALEHGGRKAQIQGELSLKGIQTHPPLGTFNAPMSMDLEFSGSAEHLKTLSLSETLKLDALNLEQRGHLTLSGMDRLLNQVLKGPSSVSPAKLLTGLGGTVGGEVKIGKGADLSGMSEGLGVNGPVNAGAEMRLIPGQGLLARGWFETPGTDVRVGSAIEMRGLQSHVNLEKRFVIRKGAGKGSKGETAAPSLSHEVLQSLSGEVEASGVEDRISRRFVEDLRGRGSARPSLAFEWARLETATLPIELSHQVLDFHLAKGLPSVDYFQVDMLGGTMVGALSVSSTDRGFALNVKGSFSAINAKRLLPDAVHGVADEQAEINGQFALAMPLSTRLDAVLSGGRLDVKLTRIGSQALERILYGLDPYENNEAIVNQRKQLRTGTPRWIHMRVQNGNLSMSGEVEVKGVRLQIPPIERLNVADLPGLERLEAPLLALNPLLKALNVLAADAIEVDDQGKLRFVSGRL